MIVTGTSLAVLGILGIAFSLRSLRQRYRVYREVSHQKMAELETKVATDGLSRATFAKIGVDSATVSEYRSRVVWTMNGALTSALVCAAGAIMIVRA